MSILKHLVFKGLALVTLFGATISTATAADAENGKKLFETYCTSCHMLGSKLVGPNLIGVTNRWPDKDKLHAFIKNSEGFIAGTGDAYATNLKKQYGGQVMPPQPVTSEQIEDILAYIETGGAGASAAPAVGGGPATPGGYVPLPAGTGFMRWFSWIGIILLAVVFLLANRIARLTRVLAGPRDEAEVQARQRQLWQNVNAVMFPLFLVVGMALVIWESGLHTEYMKPASASEHGQEIDNLFTMTLIITAIVFFVTQVLLFMFAWFYRERKGRKAFFYPHNNTVEFIWTIIPAIVLAALVLYGFKTWQKATSHGEDDVVLEAFAKQFDWTFRYPGPDGVLGRTNFLKISDTNPLGIDYDDPASHDDFLTTELHMPVDQNIRIHVRSRDVLHAIYLPHFSAQIYAQPGLDTRIRFKPLITTQQMREKENKPNFNYELACNQLCGAAHWNMRRVVVCETDEEYQQWLNAEDKTPEYRKMQAAQAQASN